MSSEYQFHYSEINPRMFSYPERKKKAVKIMTILDNFANHCLTKKMKALVALEIGCSAGGMTKVFANNFKKIIGLDIDEKALQRAQQENSLNNIKYQLGDALKLPFMNNIFDVVICNHVYEHVFDPELMMTEIYRVLKKGGICYFAAGNKYILMEGHYHLPFLSWLPKPLANFYFKIAGKGDYYYENHFSYWQLKRLIKDFQIYDYTLSVLKQPTKFFATHPKKEIIARVPLWILRVLLPAMPTFFWILRKGERI